MTAPAAELTASNDGADAALALAAPAVDLARLGLPGGAYKVRWRLSLLAAGIGHVAVLAAALNAPASRLAGAGGELLEAIDVDLISAAVFESRLAPTRQADAAPDAAVAERDGAAEEREASAASPDRKPEPDGETAPAPLEPDLVDPDFVAKEEPPDPEAPQLLIARRPAEPPEDPVPEPADASAAQAPAASEASAPAENQTAAALGGTTARGIDGIAARAAPAAQASPGVAGEYARTVIRTLARRKPRGTGVRGTVRIGFTIAPSGAVVAARVAQSSGRAELDRAALAAVRDTRFPAPPASLADAPLSYEVPYFFR